MNTYFSLFFAIFYWFQFLLPWIFIVEWGLGYCQLVGGLILWVFKDGGSTTVLGLWLFVEAWVNEYFKIFFLNAATGKATWLRAPETLLVSLLLLLFLGLLTLQPSFQLSFLSQVGRCVMSSLKLFEEMTKPKFPSLDFVWVIFLHQFIKMLS